ncbi:MAG: RCC1 domain-containing protein [Micavibrio sp.]
MLMIPRKGKMLWLPLLAVGVLMLSFVPAKVAQAACANPSGGAGDIIYNSTVKVFQYCNDTNWVRMTKPSVGSGDCVNPTLKEGELAYNKDARVLQGCAGGAHVAMGPVGGKSKWVYVTSGRYHSCAIDINKKLWCWGYAYNGQTGQGTIGDWNDVQIVEVVGASQWIDAATGYQHSCGIKVDGTLWCWGSNGSGATGLNTATGDTLTPTQISGGGTWKQVSATGGSFTCAIKSDDTLWCWGQNIYGATGLNTTSGSTLVPTQVASGTYWKNIKAGMTHTCAIKNDDTLWCWGGNGQGATGRNTTTGYTLVPTQVTGGGSWKNIGVGLYSSCGIKSDNSLWCWGWNTSGQVGDGTISASRTVPTAVVGGGSWKKVFSSGYTSCGIKSDDTLWCWGYNRNGQIGNGNFTDSSIPVAVSGGESWLTVGMATSYSCGILESGQLKCWGYNNMDPKLYGESIYPTDNSHGKKWKNVSAGAGFTCAIRNDDRLFCWGNDFGSLGSDTGGSSWYPVEVSGGGSWRSVVAGEEITCGVKTDNTGWCWGAYDYQGGLGDGSTSGSYDPVQVIGGAVWSTISVTYHYDYFYGCGIKLDGTLWCWGSNNSGQTGQGTTSGETLTPAQISGGGSWKYIDAGHYKACGIKADDTLWCWGSGWGTAPAQTSSGGTSTAGAWKAISIGGGNQYCGIKTDNTLWCWGSNSGGATGLGTTTGTTIQPTEVSGGGKWMSIATNWESSCGVKTDNSLWCWGENYYGELGIGTYDPSNVPVQAVGGTAWLNISGRQGTGMQIDHYCGIVKNGHILCTGASYDGQAGGDYAYALVPGDIMCGDPLGYGGDIMFNEDAGVMQYCDAGGWVMIKR